MNKKGYTLSELLIIIALVAIIMVIVIPNVTRIFGKSKEKIFLDNVMTAFESATTTYLNNTTLGNYNKTFCLSSTDNNNMLNINADEAFKYRIQVNNSGAVVSLFAEDGKNSFVLNYDSKGYVKSDISSDKVVKSASEFSCSDRVVAVNVSGSGIENSKLYTLTNNQNSLSDYVKYEGAYYTGNIICNNEVIDSITDSETFQINNIDKDLYCTINVTGVKNTVNLSGIVEDTFIANTQVYSDSYENESYKKYLNLIINCNGGAIGTGMLNNGIITVELSNINMPQTCTLSGDSRRLFKVTYNSTSYDVELGGNSKEYSLYKSTATTNYYTISNISCNVATIGRSSGRRCNYTYSNGHTYCSSTYNFVSIVVKDVKDSGTCTFRLRTGNNSYSTKYVYITEY